jgi:predicted XRE-type DNA-binding protein
MKTEDIKNIMEKPKEYFSISKPKLQITETIKKELDGQNISIRGLAKKIGVQHPQVLRITGCQNYTIDNLLKILDGLDLEIVIKKK